MTENEKLIVEDLTVFDKETAAYSSMPAVVRLGEFELDRVTRFEAWFKSSSNVEISVFTLDLKSQSVLLAAAAWRVEEILDALRPGRYNFEVRYSPGNINFWVVADETDVRAFMADTSA